MVTQVSGLAVAHSQRVVAPRPERSRKRGATSRARDALQGRQARPRGGAVPDPDRLQVDRDQSSTARRSAVRSTRHRFLAPVGDHYRTRLTHIVEVTQVRALDRHGARDCNEYIVEAMGIGHDMAAPRSGTRRGAAREVPAGRLPPQRAERSHRRAPGEGRSDSTSRTRCGTGNLKHSAPTDGGVEDAEWGTPETPEGWVVRYADKIAYLHHDADDAIRAGIIEESDLPREVTNALGATRRSASTRWSTTSSAHRSANRRSA